jgi:4'-phosphopantetheinyl transferase
LIDIPVWWFHLDRSPDELRALAGLLSPDEHARVARFRFVHLRQHAVAARGFLRSVLGEYLGRAPASLAFTYGPQGKPSVVDSPVQFNLAHSGGLAVCAVASGPRLGVDVELRREDIDHVGLGQECFSTNERAALASSSDGPIDGFFRCWTLKEAYVKGRGGGLSIALDSFDVPLSLPRGSVQAVGSRESSPDAQGWFARGLLPVEPGYAAALAVQASDWRVVEHGASHL